MTARSAQHTSGDEPSSAGFVVGTAGHVDHGKSTLVHALTGIDPDRLDEEKARGLTIDLGFAWWTLPSGREVGVVDVPGHERFIRNMLAGVGAIDAALFVVAADEGWKPQSAEHLSILDFLKVRCGVVALTKADLVDEETLAVAADDVRDHLRGTALESVPVVAVSATKRTGLDDLQEALDRALDAASSADDRGRPRLFVDRSFVITGAGTVVTGTLSGGSLRAGDEVEVLPSGARARIRSLQTHRRSVEVAVPGSRVAVNLVGLQRPEVARGDALVSPGASRTTDAFAARVRAARDLEHPVGERGAYELYIGSAEVPCRLKFLEHVEGTDPRSPSLRAGQDALAQVFSMRPLPVEPGDRFIVRDVGRWETVAGGVVLDHFPGRVRRGDEQVLERLRARESAEREEVLARVVAERGIVAVADLQWLTGLGPGETEGALARAEAVRLPSFVLSNPRADALQADAVRHVASHHELHPLDAGMPREALRAALALDQRAFAELAERWVAHGLIDASGATVALPGRSAVLSEQDEAAAAAALAALRAGGASPPEVAELGVGRDLLKALERRGDLVVVAPGIAYAADVLAGIERAVVELIERAGPATVAGVRDAVGTTRKFAVPLLEYLDSSGLTRRQGDARVLGPRGRQLASGGS